MKLQSVSIDRFGQLEHFRLDSLSSGLTVLHGTNGSGKTTLLNFVRFVLYGEQSGRHESTLDDSTSRGRLTFRESGAPLVIERSTSQGRSSLAAMCADSSSADDVTTRRAEVLLEQLSQDFQADTFARLFAVGQREVHEIDDLLVDVGRAGLLNTETREQVLTEQASELRNQQQPQIANGGRIWRLFENLQRLEQSVRAAEQDARERLAELNRQHAAHLNDREVAEREVAEITASLASVDDNISRTQSAIDELTLALERELEQVRSQVQASFEELQQLDAESLRVQAVIRDLENHKSKLASEIHRLEDEARLHTGNDHSTATLRETVTRLEQRLNKVQRTLESTSVRESFSQELGRQQVAAGDCPNCHEGSTSLVDVRRDVLQLCANVSRIEAQERISELQTRLDRTQCAHGDLQIHRDELVAARSRAIEAIGHIPQIEMFVRTQRVADFCRCEQHQSYWDEFRAVSFGDRDNLGVFGNSAAVTVGKFASPDVERLRQQLTALHRRQRELQDQLTEAKSRVDQRPSSITETDDTDSEDRTLRLRLQRDVTKRQLQDAVKDWCASHVAADIIEAFDHEREARRDPTVLEQASAYLNRLTEGHYRRIELDNDQQIIVHPSSGSPRRLDSFSRGTCDQIALSLRLVLAEEFARRGVDWPLILDDVFVDSDSNRTRIAVQLLAECAQRGCQIVYLTCHEYLCELFREVGIEPRRFEDCRVAGVAFVEDAKNLRTTDFQSVAELRRTGSPSYGSSQGKTNSADEPSVSPPVADKKSQSDQSQKDQSSIAMDLVVARPLTENAQLKPRANKVTDSRRLDTTREGRVIEVSSTSDDSYSSAGLASEDHGAMPDHGRLRVELHEQTDGELADESEFFLHPWSLTRQIPGLGQQAVRGLRALRIDVVGDLVQADANALRQQLGRLDIPVERFVCWQRQAQLMCRMPGLDGLSGRLLAECGYSHPDEILAADSRELLKFVRAHLRTIHGRWYAACRQSVDGSSVNGWVQSARRARAFARTPSSRRERIRQTNNQQRSRSSRSAGRLSMRQLRIDAGHTLRGPRGRRRSQSRATNRDETAVEVSDRGLGEIQTETELAEGQPIDQPSLQIWRGEKRQAGSAQQDREQRKGRESRQEKSNTRTRSGSSRSERSRENNEEKQPIETAADHSSQGVRFYLTRQSEVEDAPTIGPKMAERLAVLEIITVDDLLRSQPAQVASDLKNRRVKARDVSEWQLQSELMCVVPGLRGHDAQVLVACGVKTADQLASMEPSTLWGTVEPFVSSKKGKRLLRSANRPDLPEVTNWIEWARSRDKHAEKRLRKAG